MPDAATGEPISSAGEEIAATVADTPLAPPRTKKDDAGPLVAIASLCGGAGASTLAFLVARAAAESDERPVVVCDTGGPTGGLALYAGVASPRSLAGVAAALARDESLDDGLFADAGSGLRLIARGPELEGGDDQEAVTRLLRDARDAHALTVVDCGTLARDLDRHVLARASHVAWLLPATASGLRRAQATLAILPREPGRTEIVVARHDAAGRTPPTSELAALAAERGGPLVLMPHVSDLAERPPDEAAEAASVTVRAIQGAVRR